MRRFISGMIATILLVSAVAIDVRAAEEAVSTLAGVGSHGDADGLTAQFNLPRGVFAWSEGIYVADTFNNLIRFVDFEGRTSTLAGSILGLDVFRFPGCRHE